MKITILHISFFLLTAMTGLPQASIAQVTETVNLPQVYQVEIVLFRYTNPAKTSTETFRTPESTITQMQEQDLAGTSQPSLTDAFKQSTEGQLRWLPADAANEQLGNVSRRLAASGTYKVLAHRSWLQLAPSQSNAAYLQLADLNITPDTAVGQLTLYQKQFLYLAADIHLDGVNPTDAPAITATRKMPLGKAVYFDHPQFGLIAMVTRSDVSWPAE